MMTHALEALGRRAVACKGWRWLSGMLAADAGPAYPLSPQRLGQQFARPSDGRTWLPDLSDPATLGCLLALVREAWEGKHTTHAGRVYGTAITGTRWEACERIGWVVADDGGLGVFGRGATEAEALVAALAAAP